MTQSVVLDGESLSVEQVVAVAHGRARATLAPAARDRMLRSRRIVEDIVRRNEVVYGVTTGFGKL